MELGHLLDSEDEMESLVSSQSTRTSSPAPSTAGFDIAHLPPELRFKIWSCASEPRLVMLNDLVRRRNGYALPKVTQLNKEARRESRVERYQQAGIGSYVDFARDFVVCDQRLADKTTSDPVAERIAWEAKRVVFWDCHPDEERIKAPEAYSKYLSYCYDQKSFGQVAMNRFWFPNVKEFWSVKIGDIDTSWRVPIDKSQPPHLRRRDSAREFRYWVDHDIIDMAILDLSNSDAVFVLREGRCERENCQELNAQQSQIVSKVNFMDGKYEEPDDGRHWVRILLKPKEKNEAPNSTAAINRMRWFMVERSFTYHLQWEWPNSSEENPRQRRRKVQETDIFP